MPMLKPNICCKYMINIVGLHKCLVSNYICSKCKRNLKPVTCHYRLPTHFFKDICLPYQVKTQYLQIYNRVDTSIKHQISGQSTTVVKACMYIWLIW